jgi:curved DNA-binding protein
MAHDYYQRLGVARQASVDEIKKAYRRLAKQYHPDVNPGSKSAEEKFRHVTEAFEVLSDPRKRRLYDEFGEDAAKMGWDEKKAEAYRAYRSAGASSGFGGAPFNADFSYGGQGGGAGPGIDFESIFGEMFGGQRRGRRGPRPGADLSTDMQVTLREAVLGAERAIKVNGKHLSVRIPAGVETGSRIRLAGQGAPGESGGPAGDLFVDIEVAPHPFVRREGNDLLLDLPVTIREATMGAELRVPTFSGSVTLTLKPKTQSGMRLRLRGQGVPDLRGGAVGDLYLVVQVKLPHKDDEATRKAIKVLEAAYEADVRAELVL